MWPTLQVIRDLGGSARIDEITEGVVEREGFTEEQQQVMRRPDDHTSMIDYRLAWARNYLKNIGALENSARGVWAVTERGRELDEHEIPELVREWKREYYRQRKLEQKEAEVLEDDADDDLADWTEALLDRLLQLDPGAFERLTQRLLREAGFRNVEVLGRSGDGGLDGVGVYRVSLVSFPVYFQCKRYKGSVPSSAVRDFRGAMSGRGEKGLLITTGSFTKGAREEATRDGAPPVELVSGDDLCELLKQYELGVSVRTVEVPEVDQSFFDQF
jgi:restriction system protein